MNENNWILSVYSWNGLLIYLIKDFYMERRHFYRINGGFETEIIYKDRSYKGIIDDLSEKGVGVITIPAEIEMDFIPGSSINLKFQPHPGETLVLNCRIKWFNKGSLHGLKYRIGMEVIDPPWKDSNSFI